MSPEVQAALIGAGATFAAAIFAILGVTKTIRHDRLVRQTDAEFQLRKDILVDTVAAIARVTGALTSLPLPSYTLEKCSEELSSMAATFAKVHLVADRNSREVVIEASKEITTTYLLLAPWKIDQLRRDADILEHHSQQLAVQDQIKAILSFDLRHASRDDFEATRKQYVILSDRAAELAEILSRLEKKKAASYPEFVTRAQSRVRELAPVTIRLTSAFRSTFGLDTDAEWFEQKISRLISEVGKNVQSFLEEELAEGSTSKGSNPTATPSE